MVIKLSDKKVEDIMMPIDEIKIRNSKLYNDIKKNEDLTKIDLEDNVWNSLELIQDKDQNEILVNKNNKAVGVVDYKEIICFLHNEINKSSLIFKYIFDNIQEAVCFINCEGKVMIWNHNAERLYGLSRDSILNKKLEEFFPDSINMEVLKSKKTVENIYHVPKEGCHIIISAAPIFLNDEFIGVISTDKDVSDIKRLSKELRNATERVELLQRELEKISGKEDEYVVGKSKKIQQKIQIAELAAKSNAPVLILGESGTGKEIFARNIHKMSCLKGDFIPVNCSAIPTELFESEFFGYESGAFTGANKRGKAGYFELANNGTLFLDEIGELPMEMQCKLLRALQEKKIRRVGAEKTIKVNTRILSATNQKLEELIKQKKFRLDLYYRLNVIKIELPPLRERKEDIILFIDFFLKKFNKEYDKNISEIDKDVVGIFTSYKWLGNIRELSNVMEQMIVLCNNEIITKDMIPEYIIEDIQKDARIDFWKKENNGELGLRDLLAGYEKYLIDEALEETNGNIVKAANKLKIPRSTLHYKIDNYK